MDILEILNASQKKCIARDILEALPEWFGLPESREEYIEDSGDNRFFCAYMGGQPVGFLCLKQTGKDTVELAVMGVLKEYHMKNMITPIVSTSVWVLGNSKYFQLYGMPGILAKYMSWHYNRYHPRGERSNNGEQNCR